MRRLFLFVLLLLGASAQAQPAPQRTNFDAKLLLWQGVSLQWEQPQLFGQWGGGIRAAGEQAQVGNRNAQLAIRSRGAGGKWADNLAHTHHVSAVDFDGGMPVYGTARLKVSNTEGVESRLIQPVKLGAPPELRNREQYITLLNGVELVCEEAYAEQLEMLDLRIGESGYDPTDSTLNFELNAGLIFTCEDRGCEACLNKNTTYTYTVLVHYVIIGADSAAIETRRANLSRTDVWNSRDPALDKPEDFAVKFREMAPASVATAGLKAMRIVLNEPHFMSGMNLWLEDLPLQTDGTFPFRSHFNWQQWRPGKDVPRRNKKKKWRNAGAAEFKVEVQFLRFEAGCITHRVLEQEIPWPGRRKVDHNSPSQARLEAIELPMPCQEAP